MGKIQHPGSISNEKCACDSFPSSLSFMLEGFRESTTSFVTLPNGFQDMEQVFGNDKYSVGDAGKRQRVSTSMECLLHSQTAEDHLGSNTSRGILGYMERLQPQKKNSECGRGGGGEGVPGVGSSLDFFHIFFGFSDAILQRLMDYRMGTSLSAFIRSSCLEKIHTLYYSFYIHTFPY